MDCGGLQRMREHGNRPRHILTVRLEDYYQASHLGDLIPDARWNRFQPRLAANVDRLLELLDRVGARATFFTSGWTAGTAPGVLAAIAARGHELAAHGSLAQPLSTLPPGGFRADACQARDRVEQAAGVPVRGFRARTWLGPGDLRALDELAEAGFAYDSSVCPAGRPAGVDGWRRFPFPVRDGFWELPVSSLPLFGFSVPVGLAAWHRHLPRAIAGHTLGSWSPRRIAPAVLDLAAWELDPGQPRISAAPVGARVIQYRNLDQMPRRLERVLQRQAFGSAADWLGHDLPAPADRPPAPIVVQAAARPPAPVAAASDRREPVTVLVPCYNEVDGIAYLAAALDELETKLEPRYAPRFLFVDDGSKDGTAAELERRFADRPNRIIVRHAENRGIAAAVMTGLTQADTELVCCMDADCSYDPLQLVTMLEAMTPGTDLITASPYHRDGMAENIPPLRLLLSRSLSRIYALLLRHRLATYTSCLRVYRRSAIAGMALRHLRFIGIAEILLRVDRQGGAIVEVPATLRPRLLGTSKLKLLRTIAEHLQLIVELMSGACDPPRRVVSQGAAPHGAPGATTLQTRN